LLVAIAIFALMAVGAYRLLAGTISVRERGEQHESELRHLQKAEVMLQRDLLQVAMRPIRDEFGDVQPAFYLPKENVMEFTRRGWRNPTAELRSDLQRVRYRLENGKIWRDRWNVLDRVRMTQPASIVLLDQVESFQIRVFYKNKEEIAWPTLAQIQHDKATLPLPDAVEFRIQQKNRGEIKRLVSLPENLEESH
jgi:general secretion pathway protein J